MTGKKQALRTICCTPRYQNLFIGCLLALFQIIPVLGYAQPTNDNQAAAIALTNLNNWCSTTGAYTNLNANPDIAAGTCWTDNDGNGFNNVWFSFVATTTDVTVQVLTEAGGGNMRAQQFALLDASNTELGCAQAPDWYYGPLSISYTGLTVGDTYYIMVDSRRNDGNFSLCIDDQLSYDYFSNAHTLTNLNAWCSGPSTFTNVSATADQSPGSCWQNNGGTGNKNVWFAFQATTPYINIEVLTSAGSNRMRGQQFTLYDAGLNELQCRVTPDWYYGNAQMSHCGLTVGDWYYIAVDARRNDGWFELCIDDQPTYDCLAGAHTLSNLNTWCSGPSTFSNETATADQSPGSCWEDNGGTGNKNVWFTFQATTSSITIDVITSSGGANMRGQQFALYDAALNELSCVVMPDWYYGNAEMSYCGLTVGDWYYIAVDSRRNDGWFELCVDDEPSYDCMDGAHTLSNLNAWCSSSSTFTNIGATPDQSPGSCWQDDGGTGNKNVWFTFQATTSSINIDVITASGTDRMRGQQFALYDAALNELECVTTPSWYYGNAEMTYCGLTVGDWYYIAVEARRDDGWFELCVDDQPGYDCVDGAHTLSDLDAWCSGPSTFTNLTATSDQSPGGCWQDNGGTGNKNVWFTFQATSGSIDIDVLSASGSNRMRGQQFALYDAAMNELGCTVSSDWFTGTLSATYSGLTMGDQYYIAVDARRNDGWFEICVDSDNLLPVELTDFEATAEQNQVHLSWTTASELNNDYFTVEKSLDGIHFEEVVRLSAAGNSNQAAHYTAIDANPYHGLSYYRLTQTDFDGQSEHLQVVAVEFEQPVRGVVIYPNPTAGRITIQAAEPALESIKVYNMLGQDLSHQTHQRAATSNTVVLDLSQLPSGWYQIKTKHTVNSLYKR